VRGDRWDDLADSLTGDDPDVVAVVYEIGGRHESTPDSGRPVSRDELYPPADGPVSQDQARGAYRARIANRERGRR
jgi:hypothetical protein